MHNRDSRNPQHVNGTFCASSFIVGQHVVCVDDKMDPHARRKWERRGVRFPVKSIVYTVRQVLITPKGNPAVLLIEIENPLVRASGLYLEAFFLAWRFRPLQKLKLEDFMPIVEHLTYRVTA